MNSKLAAGIGVTTAIVVGLLMYFYFFRIKAYHPEITRVVPENAWFVFQTSNAENLYNEILQAPFYKNLESNELSANLKSQVIFIDSLLNFNKYLNDWKQGRSMAFSVHPYADGSFHMFIAIDANHDALNFEAIKPWFESFFPNRFLYGTHIYKQAKINDLTDTKGENSMSICFLENYVLFSFDGLLVEEAISQIRNLNKKRSRQMEQLSFVKTLASSDMVYLNYNQIQTAIQPCLKTGSPEIFDHFADLGAFQFSTSSYKTECSGATLTNDSVFQFLDIFTGQMPGSMLLAPKFPIQTGLSFEQHISDWRNFQVNLSEFNLSKKESNKRMLDSINNLCGQDISSRLQSIVGFDHASLILNYSNLSIDSNRIAMVKPDNIQIATKILEELKQNFKTKNNIDSLTAISVDSLNHIPINAALSIILGPAFNGLNADYFSVCNDFILFANNPNVLAFASNEIKNANTFDQSESYNDYKENAENFASIEMMVLNQQSVQVLSNISQPDFQSALYRNQRVIRQCPLMLMKFAPQTSKIFNSQLLWYFNKNDDNMPEQMWEYTLDTNIASIPSILSIPEKGNQWIFVQDIKHTLYCFENSGILRWKLPMAGKILGEIQYKISPLNQSIHLLFNTEHQLYMVNDSGKVFQGYPFWIPAATNQMLQYGEPDANGIFDIYIASRFYKLWILSSDLKLKACWNPREYWPNAVQSPVAFNLHGKKYVFTVNENGSFHILDEKAKFITPLLQDSNQFIRSAFLMANDTSRYARFICADSSGNLSLSELYNDTSYKIISRSSIGFNANRMFRTGDYYLCQSSDNTLAIFNAGAQRLSQLKLNNIPLQISVLARKQVNYLIYSDSTSHSVHAQNSNGDEYSGFPFADVNTYAIGGFKGDAARILALAKYQSKTIQVVLIK